MCRGYDRRGSLRSAGFDSGRVPGIGADCRHADQSSECEHHDGWLDNRFRRERLIRYWSLGWGHGQPIGDIGHHRFGGVLSRWFRRIFGERCDGTVEQRSGVGALPTRWSLGDAALSRRDQSILRTLMEFGSDRDCVEPYRSVSKV